MLEVKYDVMYVLGVMFQRKAFSSMLVGAYLNQDYPTHPKLSSFVWETDYFGGTSICVMIQYTPVCVMIEN